MNRPHPAQQMNFPISINLYQQLLGAAQDTGFQKEYWEIGAEALADWLRRHKSDAIAMAKIAGYQWKQVFLPNGTLLRTVFNGKNHHCAIEDDRILYEGRSVSPSGFVNAVGGIRRNAWKSLWILLPDEKTWKLADSLRPPKCPDRPRARRPSMPVREETTAPLPGAHCAPYRVAGENTPEPQRFADESTPEPQRLDDESTSEPQRLADESTSEPRRLAVENLSEPPPRPVRAPGVAAPVPAKGEEIRGVGPRPNRLDDIGHASAADPLRPMLSQSGDRRAEANERRLGENEALGALVRETLLAFSRGVMAIQHER